MNACTIEGCTGKYRARGYCASHYNQILKPDRHRTTLICGECGQQYVTTRTNGRFCSLTCRDDARLGTTKAERDAAKDQIRAARESRARARDEMAEALTPLPRNCVWCGSPFSGRRVDALHCSRRCKRKASRARRRALEHGADGCYTWVEVVRLWLSIDKCCAYCRKPTNDIEPDHVVALSRGGSNSITNVVPSCPPCNADKRELTLSEWSADRDRRGLGQRWIDPRLTHLTDALLVA